jgi:nitrogen fixation protein
MLVSLGGDIADMGIMVVVNENTWGGEIKLDI